MGRRAATYDEEKHTVVYTSKKQCFEMCAADCEAAASLRGDGLSDEEAEAISIGLEEL